jgi:hypothetical protein
MKTKLQLKLFVMMMCVTQSYAAVHNNLYFNGKKFPLTYTQGIAVSPLEEKFTDKQKAFTENLIKKLKAIRLADLKQQQAKKFQTGQESILCEALKGRSLIMTSEHGSPVLSCALDQFLVIFPAGDELNKLINL